LSDFFGDPLSEKARRTSSNSCNESDQEIMDSNPR
jgi:hypothetical protein